MVLCLVFSMNLASFADARTLGNEQYYTVYLDEEGDAIVMAQLTFHNAAAEDLDVVVLEVPGQIDVVNLIQEVTIRIEDESYWHGYYETTEYRHLAIKTERLSESTLLTVTFDESVSSQERGSIWLYYKVPELATENVGLYDFAFTTIKTAFDTQYVRVNAEAINGLVMKDVKSDVNYQEEHFTSSAAIADIVMEPEAYNTLQEDMMHKSYPGGYYGGLIREAHGLDPYESFVVSGEYATSEFRLHLVRNIFLIGIAALTLGVGGVGIRQSLKTKRKGNSKRYTHGMIHSAVAGLIVALFVTCSIWLSNNLYQWISWEYSGILLPLIAFTTFLLAAIGLVGPGLILGVQAREWKLGVICGITSVVTMLLGTIVAVLLLALL